MLDAWAARTPEAPALVAEGRPALTHGAFAERRSAFAKRLNSLGFGRNDRIAIVHPGGPEAAATIVSVYGCATAVPLNPDATLGEFVLCMKDLHIQGLIVAADFDTPSIAAAAHLDIPVLRVVGDAGAPAGWVELTGETRRNPCETAVVQPDDVAVILRTSGSTGNSKTVPITHRRFAVTVRNAVDVLALSEADRALNLMPLFHQHGLSTALSASLYAGGSVICMERFDVETFFRWLEELRPTNYNGSYTFHHSIAVHAAKYEGRIAAHSMRFGRTGSGWLEPDVAVRLEAALGIPIIQTYATSETSIITCNPLPPRERKLTSVGVPLAQSVAIKGVDGELKEPGETGEIWVRGPNVFDGYENDSAATAAAFEDGWFRTGDAGYFNDDGYLFLTGRIKEIINRGGEKVTPAEVDNALMAHPDVRQAATFPIPHPTLGEEVAAAIVLEPGASLDTAALSAFVRKRLAGFKAPRRIVFVDAIPLGPTGKVLRRTLASALGLEIGPSSATVSQAPGDGGARARSALEARLAALWADALGLDYVGLDDDFFLLGGDSLQAVELFLRVEQAFGHRLPRSVLFEAGTVSAMAERIAASVPSSCLVPIQPDGDRPPFFCVHDQNGHVLNFRDLARHLGPDQPFYGLQAVGLDGEEVPFTRADDMATHYVREIRKIQPVGPYYIGGYSFGGRIAYVMAQQLSAAGESVALLALLDSYYQGAGRRVSARQWLARHRERMSRLGLDEMPSYLRLRFQTVTAGVTIALRSRLYSAAWRYYEEANRTIPRFLRNAAAANDMIRHTIHLQPYNGSAVLFKAELPASMHPDVHDGWRSLVEGGFDIRPVPGRHFDFLKEPNVRTLAAELADCLDERQARYAPSVKNRVAAG